MPGFSWPHRRREGFQRFELGIMRVMAMGAEQILLVAIPVSGSLAVNSDLPVTKFIAMALPTKTIRFGE